MQIEIDINSHHGMDGEYSATFDLLAERNSMHGAEENHFDYTTDR